jgi:hypothetical protein
VRHLHYEEEIIHLLKSINRKLDYMTTPTGPQPIIDQASVSLEQAATSLQAIATALPVLLAGDGTPVDTTALVQAVTDVINGTNAIVALLPAGTVPASS